MFDYQNIDLCAYLAEVTRQAISGEGQLDLERYLFLLSKGFVKGLPGVYEDDLFKISLNNQDDLTVWTKVKDASDDDLFIKVFTSQQGVSKIVVYSDWIKKISAKIPLN